MNVMFVTRDFPNQTTYWNTNELTLEVNLMNVMFVTRNFLNQAVY
jgi:hypothetical protein